MAFTIQGFCSTDEESRKEWTMSSDGKQRFYFGGPADGSLLAYKTWIRSVVEQGGGVDNMTDAQWEASWRQFWSGDATGGTARADLGTGRNP